MASRGGRKIAFLVSSMHGGGAERVAAFLCNQWVDAGHDVTLIPTFSGRGDCVYPLDERVRLEHLADVAGTTSKNFWTKIHRFLVLRKLVKGLTPDVVVSFMLHVNAVSILALLGTGIPVIVSERIYPPMHPGSGFWQILRRLTYPLANLVVAQTHIMKEWLETEVPRSRVSIISNPVVWPLPEAQPVIAPENLVSKDRKLLLAVGRLEPQKGFDMLIEAFARLAPQFPQWDLAVLGDGAQRDNLESASRSRCLSGRVFLPGRAGNMAQWYRRADLYVMSSRYEGFPNALLEALAHGLPAVSFDCETGPGELITHGENGLLVPPSAGVDGLASSLSEIMTDRQKLAAMSVCAEKIRQKFSAVGILALWEAAFSNVQRSIGEA